MRIDTKTNGNATKAFRQLLHSPSDYDEMFFSFNIPEFIVAPTQINRNDLESKIEKQELKSLVFK